MVTVSTRQIQANGLTFTVDEAGEGDKVAVLLHGFPESRFSWRFQIPLLVELGYHVIAPDMRGYGTSSRPPLKSDYHISKLVEDVAGLFDAVGAKQRLLVAHDWGALIAWTFAMDKRLPLDGLIIMNVPHPAVFAHVIQTVPAQRKKSWYVGFFQIPWLPEFGLTRNKAKTIGEMFSGMAIDKSRFPAEVTDVYRQNALIPGAMTAMINYYRANRDLLGRYGGATPLIEVPTLMVWGEDDAALDIACTEGYAPYVADFTLKRLPGVSHWVQQEAPEHVNAYVRDWIGTHL